MKRRSQFVVAVLALAPLLAVAQAPSRSARLPRRPASHTTVQQIEAMQPSLARHASIIFFGRVADVCRIVPESGAAESSLQITFAVDNGVRGAQTGQEFHLLEWPGRWQAGERYRIGERYLLFLHAPNAAGLTSPVGGTAGRFLIDSKGTIDLSSVAPPGTERNIPASASSPVSDPPQRPPQPRTALPHEGPPYAHPQVRPE
jgi:hypothetical protein